MSVGSGWVCETWFGLFLRKQKTADEMRISDWSSDECSSDLLAITGASRKSEPFSKGELMRRRTLLAAFPAAALLPTAGLAGGQKPKTAPAAPKADAAKPPVWEAGADRFVRPDVHGGDRVKIGRAHV